MAPLAQHLAVSVWLTDELASHIWRLRRAIIKRGAAPNETNTCR
jgi:hypothetical protein